MFMVSFDPGVVFMGMAVLCLTGLKLDLSMINFHDYRIEGVSTKKKKISESEMCSCVLAFVIDYTPLFQYTKYVCIEQQKISARRVKDVAMLLFAMISAKFPHIQTLFIDPLMTRRFWCITVQQKDHPGKKQQELYKLRKSLTEAVFNCLCDNADLVRVIRCLTINKKGKGKVTLKDPMDAAIQLGYFYLNRHLYPNIKPFQVSVRERNPLIRAVKLQFLEPGYNHAKMVSAWSKTPFVDTAASTKKRKAAASASGKPPPVKRQKKATTTTTTTTTTKKVVVAAAPVKKPRTNAQVLDDSSCSSFSSESSSSEDDSFDDSVSESETSEEEEERDTILIDLSST
jgi:hypothetical protein